MKKKERREWEKSRNRNIKRREQHTTDKDINPHHSPPPPPSPSPLIVWRFHHYWKWSLLWQSHTHTHTHTHHTPTPHPQANKYYSLIIIFLKVLLLSVTQREYLPACGESRLVEGRGASLLKLGSTTTALARTARLGLLGLGRGNGLGCSRGCRAGGDEALAHCACFFFFVFFWKG